MSGSALILTRADFAGWRERWKTGEVPDELPYGLQHLENAGYEVSAPPRRLGGIIGRAVEWLERTFPMLGGIGLVLPNLSIIRRSDLVISLFEDKGVLLGLFWRAIAPQGRLVMFLCWLAEDSKRFSSTRRSLTLRSLRNCSSVFVFSSNQKDDLARELGIDPASISVCKFGIDTTFFSMHPSACPVGDYFLSVGRDRSRDYATLISAARGFRYPVVIVTPTKLGPLPPNVSWMPGVSHAQYLELLHGSLAVLVPTHAPRYPGGQTVVLEAMAAGKAVVTTDSEAIRDYIRDNEDGLLVAAHDPRRLADAIERIAVDSELRQRIASSARSRALATFDTRDMWQQFVREVGDV